MVYLQQLIEYYFIGILGFRLVYVNIIFTNIIHILIINKSSGTNDRQHLTRDADDSADSDVSS